MDVEITKNPLITNRKAYGLKKEKETWHNNNSTQTEKLYIVDLKNLYQQPIRMIKDLFEYKIKNKDETFVIVPVAGWKAKKPSIISQIFSSSAKKEDLIEAYTKSFSLSSLATAKNASVALRVSKEAQKMRIIKHDGQYYFRVSAGVRITDGDEFLFDKGFALLPNMTTLHPATFIGTASLNCYGPARDLPSLTTDIVRMKILNAFGEKLTLSATENPHLFEVLRDGHLGSCFVRNITLKIEPKFLMKRHNMLFKDVIELKEHIFKNNFIDKEHFIAMYIPVDITSHGEHSPRIRITNFERTTEKPKEKIQTQKQKDFHDYLNLKLTETGEPLIDLITKSPILREFFPFFLKTMAYKTYGTERENFHIDWSASIVHVFGTYTSLPIYDINWLIQVDGVEDARELLLELLELSEKLLMEQAKEHHYPLMNAFSRYLKGLYYPEGKGGIAATAVEKEDQGILSFEFVTYMPLSETEAFKSLLNAVVTHLQKNKRKYNYHPGKHMPEGIHSLEQIYTDPITKQIDPQKKQKLENFKKALYELHGGEENIPYSPFLTPQKKEFLGFKTLETEKVKEKNLTIEENKDLSELEKRGLEMILNLAKENEHHHREVIQKATQYLEKLNLKN